MASVAILRSLGVVALMAGTAFASTGLVTESPIRHPNCPLMDDPQHPVHLPYTNDCNKYYTCKEGLAYAMTCPNQLQWNILTYRCDPANIVNCELTPNPSPPASPQPLPPAYTYLPHGNDCNKFLACSAINCPSGQHWNAMLNRCDSPLTAGCSAATPPSYLPTAATPPAYTTPPHDDGTPTSPTIPTLPTISDDLNALCSSPGINYVHYPNDCRKFIQCNGIAFVRTCPANLFWNSELLTCDRFCK